MRALYGCAIALGLLLGAAAAVYGEEPEDVTGDAGEYVAGEDYGATGLYVYSLEEPAVELPPEMAQHAGTIFLGCEIRGTNLTPYADLSAVVSPTNDYGQAQINIIHAAGMARAGLDFYSEEDRLIYSIVIWESRGRTFGAWSCARRMGIE